MISLLIFFIDFLIDLGSEFSDHGTQLFQLKPRQSIDIYRHRNLESMAPKGLGKGSLGGEDLGKGSEKTSPNRAGLGFAQDMPDVGLLTEAMAPKLIDLRRVLGKVGPSHEIAPLSWPEPLS